MKECKNKDLPNHECGSIYNTANADAQQKTIAEENLLEPETGKYSGSDLYHLAILRVGSIALDFWWVSSNTIQRLVSYILL